MVLQDLINVCRDDEAGNNCRAHLERLLDKINDCDYHGLLESLKEDVPARLAGGGYDVHPFAELVSAVGATLVYRPLTDEERLKIDDKTRKLYERGILYEDDVANIVRHGMN